MDFLHRNANNQPQAPRGDNTAAFNHMNTDKKGGLMGQIGHEPQWLRITFVVLLFSLTILAVAIALLMYFGKANEARYVSDEKYQAVFLTNGQVYFGQVNEITSDYVDLRDIYYLNTQSQEGTTDQAKAASSFSLVKLGCELHGPTDQMVINRAQVSFWENLSTEGKVGKAISQWKTENPEGQKCDTTSNSTQQSDATTPATPTTPSATTPATDNSKKTTGQ